MGIRSHFRRYLRCESGEIVLDDVLGRVLWIPVLVLLVTFVVLLAVRGTDFISILDRQDTVLSIVDGQALETAGAVGTIYPPSTIGDPTTGTAGSANCTGVPQFCEEKVIYSRALDGDHYDGYETIVGAGKRPSVLIHFSTSGFSVAGVAQNVTVLSRIMLSPGENLAYASIPAPQIATDARNPAAPIAAAYQTALGATPVVRTIAWGPPLAVGNNDLELARVDVGTLHFTTGMAISTLPAKNVHVVVGFVTPTPLPSIGPLSGSTLTWHWPAAAAGPTSFQVHMLLYHDAYFAESTSCVAPNPLYVPGTSPTYIPGIPPNPPNGMFGVAGPWVYPNPNPLVPVNSDSGPATFSIAPITAGVCDIPIYTTYQDRSGPPFFGYPADVMGFLTLSQNGSSATSQTGPLALTGPSSGGFMNAGDSATISASKTFDDDPAGLSPQVALDSTCAPLFSVVVTPGGASGNPSGSETGSITLKLTSTSTSQISCSGTVTDQYGEPPVHFATTVVASAGPITSWPPAIQFPTSGTALADARAASEFTLALEINALLGGGVASAASLGACGIDQPRVFASAAALVNGTPLANAADPFGFGFSSDANGCELLHGQPVSASMPSVAINETGYMSTFGDGVGTCGSSIRSGQFSPGNALGPRVGQSFTGVSPIASCNLAFTDVASQQAVVVASVAATGCEAVSAGSPCLASVIKTRSVSVVTCTIFQINTGDCLDPQTHMTFSEMSFVYETVDSGATWTEIETATCSTGDGSPCTPVLQSGSPPPPGAPTDYFCTSTSSLSDTTPPGNNPNPGNQGGSTSNSASWDPSSGGTPPGVLAGTTTPFSSVCV